MSKKPGPKNPVRYLLPLLALAALFLTGCELFTAGLGSKVDVSAPVLTLASYSSPTGTRDISSIPYLRGDITLTGTVTDDRGVASVTISYKTTQGSTNTVTATLGTDTWTVTLKAGLAATDAEYATSLAEGEQNATITATDTSNKTATVTASFFVDNKAPAVLATSPLTYGTNLPTFYRTIDLKGEAYDPSPLESVTVQLVKTDGTVLDTKVADGTNTWAVRFDHSADSSPLTDNTVYGYNILARDKAGNANTHFYHRFDIYPLLTASGGYVTFPSMNELGGLDQNASGSLASGLDWAELSTIQKGAALASWPDFRFKKTDSPAVQWQNLQVTAGSAYDPAIGTGVPIVGTIMPPSDGSSITPSSVVFSIFNSTSQAYMGTGPASGTTTATQAVFSTESVGASLNFRLEPEDNTGQDLSTGSYIVAIRFTTNSGMTGTAQQAFEVSSEAPSLEETGVGGAGNPVLYTTMTKSALTLAGKAYNSDGSPADLTVTIDSGTSTTVTLDTQNSFSIAIAAPADHSNDGTHTYVLKATNASGLQTILSRTVLMDTTQPAVNLTSPAAGAWVVGKNPTYTLAGVSDDTATGSGIKSVHWLVTSPGQDHSADTAWAASPWSTATGTVSWQASINPQTLGEGDFRLWTVTEDQVGNLSRNYQDFHVDYDFPRATLSAVGTISTIDGFNATAVPFTLSGIADDDALSPGGTVRAASSVLLSWTKNGVPDSVALTPSGSAWSWSSASKNLTDGSHDGLYQFVLTVTDEAGKITTQDYAIKVDTTAPTLSVSTPVNNAITENSSYTINGSVMDLGVGLDAAGTNTVTWALNGAAEAQATLSGTDWSKTLSLTTEGTNTLTIHARDKLGNHSQVGPLTFFYDQAPPTVTETVVGSENTTSKPVGFNLSGALADTNALQHLTITQSKDGGSAKTVLDTAESGTSQTWDTGLTLPRDPLAADTTLPASMYGVADSTASGVYVYVITVTDAAGRTTSVTRNISIDLTDPTITALASIAGYQSGTFSISNTAQDNHSGASGIAKVEYTLDGSTWLTAASVLQPGQLPSSWSVSLNTLAMGEGNKTVSFRATDNATRISTVVPTTFKVDNAYPQAIISSPAAASSQSRTDVALSGTADDASLTGGRAASSINLEVRHSNGTSISASLTGTGATPATTTLGGNTLSWTQSTGAWSWTLPTSLGDDSYYLTLTVTDEAGKVSTATRTVKIDTTAPTINVVAPGAGASFAVTTININGSMSDAGGTGFDGVGGNVDAEYYTLDPGAASPGWTSMTLSSGAWSATGLSLGSTEGSRTLQLRSTDAVGNVATKNVTVYYDLNPPALSETAVNTTDTRYLNADLTLTGLASDSNSLDAVNGLHVTVNGVDQGSIPVTAGTGVWSWIFDADARADGTYVLIFTALDVAGKTTTLTRTLVIDRTLPTVTVTDVTGYRSGTIPVSGTATDANPDLVEYQLDSSGWVTAAGTASWTGSLDLSTASEGTRTLSARAKDKAGNFSTTASDTFEVDRADPAITETLHSGTLVQSRISVNFSGAADDDAVVPGAPLRTASSLKLALSRDGNSVGTWTLTGAGASAATAAAGGQTFSWTQNTGAWTWTLAKDADGADNILGNADDMGDGLYIITFTVTDAAGKTASLVRSVQLDTTAPVIAVATPGANQRLAVASVTATGTILDTGGTGFDGTADVEYRLSTDGTMDTETWTDISASLSGINWTTASLSLGAEGTKYLEVRSTDKVGNSSTQSVTFHYDLADPSLTETLVATTDTQYRSSDLTFSGLTGDSNSLASLSLSIDGAAATSLAASFGAVDADGPDNIAGNADDNARTWSYVYAASTASEVTHTLVFTATDTAGKTTSLTRSVLVDRTVPSLSGITDLTVGWKIVASQSIAGTATEAGSGLLRVEFRTSADAGSTWSSWANLTGTGSFSGTVSFAEGSLNRLEIRAVDKAGNTSTPAAGNKSAQSVLVDTIDPDITSLSLSTTVYVNGRSSLAFTVNSADASSQAATAKAKINSTDMSSSTVDQAIVANAATITIPAASLAALSDGSHRIYVRVYDNAGRNSVAQAINLVKDSTSPTVTFTSHTDGATINKTVSFGGTASEANILGSVTVMVLKPAAVNAGSFVIGSSYRILSVGSTDFTALGASANTVGTSFKALAAGSGSGTASLWVDATTQAGTVLSGTNSWSLSGFDTTNIATWIPATYDADSGTAGTQLRIGALALDGAGNTGSAERLLSLDQDSDKPVVKLTNLATTGTPTLKQTTLVYGSITDDDGSVTLLRMKNASGDSWTTVTLDGQSFTYTVTGVDGSKDLYFEITDAAGTVFTTAASASSSTPRLFQSTGVWLETPLGFKLDTVNPTIDNTVGIKVGAAAWADYTSSAAWYGGSGTGSFLVRIQASDANGIASASMKITDIASGSVTQAATYDGSTWWTSTVPLSVTGLADGAATLSVTVVDSSGLSTTLSKTITIDNTAPSGSFLSPSTMTVVNGDLALKGLANDLTSGLASVEYDIGNLGTWTPVSSGTYSWQVNFTGAGNINTYATATWAAYNSGDDTWLCPIRVRVTDKAGNTWTSGATDYQLKIDPSGDKPKVSLVYPSDPAAPLGGTVRVYGSATDDDAVYAAYMQIDANNNGDWTDDTNVAGTNWYNGGLGRAMSGQNSWFQNINTSGEFNPSGLSTKTIGVRVRAQDTKNGTSGDIYGPWVSTTITFDNNVPKIGSTTSLYLDNGSTQIPYTYGMYITGSWTLKGSVEDESAINSILVSGDLTASTGGTNSGWFSAASWAGSSGYNLVIPVTTAANSSGSLTFALNAYDNTSPTAREATLNLKINYDNQAPTATFTGTTPVVQSNGWYKIKGTAEDVGSDVDHVAVYLVRKNLNGSDAVNYDRFFNPLTGAAVPVTGGDTLAASNGTFTYPATAAACIIKVDHKDITEVHGTPITNDDGDGLVEKLVQDTGSTYSWYVDIDSSLIPDGNVDIHYVVFDKSGNTTHYVSSTSIQNNLPTLASITLGTDLDGSTAVTSGEKVLFATTAASTSTGSLFTTKAAPMTLDLGAASGNGNLYYTLSVPKTSGGTYSITKTLLRTGTGGSVVTIDLDSTALTAIGDGLKTFTLTVWDSTEETTPGTNSLSVSKDITTTVKVTDTTAPTAAINPFFWASSGSNSLYGYSKANGHIELTSIAGGSGPDVSGKISIRGTAYDDQRLTSLWMHIDGFSFPYTSGTTPSSTSFDTNADGSAETLSNTYYQVATYSAGVWTGTDHWTVDGWKFTVTPVSLDQTGHSVTWQLDWDSSKITNVAVSNANIRVLAEDRRTSPNASPESPTQTTTGTPTPLYTVDVVPYISGIVRGGSYNTNRSRYGAVAVQSGETGLVINGFNLYGGPGTNNVQILNAATNTGDTTGAATGTAVTVTGTGTSSLTITAPAKSGYLKVFANSIGSTNNINNNDSKGSYADTGVSFADRQNYWNREVVSTNTRSTDWTDNRYLSVWKTGNYLAGSNNISQIEYPAMGMDNTGKIYGSWIDYNNNTVWYNFNGADGSTTGAGTLPGINTVNMYYDGYDPAEYSDISVDPNDSTVNVAFLPNPVGSGGTWSKSGFMNLDNNGGISVYSPNAQLMSIEGKDDNSQNARIYAIESEGMDLQLKQFQRPKVVRSNGGAAASDRIHVVYYDAKTKAAKYSFMYDDSYAGASEQRGWLVLDGGYDGQDQLLYNNQGLVFGNGTVTATTTLNVGSTTNIPSGTTVSFDDVGGVSVKRITGTTGTNVNWSGNLTTTNYSNGSLATWTVHPNVVMRGQVTTPTRTTTTLVDSSLVGTGVASLIHSGLTISIRGNNVVYHRTLTAWDSATGTATWSAADPVADTALTDYTIYLDNFGSAVVTTNESASQSSAAGQYIALDVDEQGYPVVMYYDTANATLRLARATSLTPKLPSDWVRQTVFASGDSNASYSGLHIAMKIDYTGAIHATCYQSSTGNLIYLHAPNNTGTGAYTFDASTVVDTGGVGTWADIAVNGTTPSITYLNNAMVDTADGVKYATLSGSSWDYLIVPAPADHPPTSERLGIEVKHTVNDARTLNPVTWTSTFTATWGEAAIGYRSDRFELVYLQSEP